jgi:hypothetical protein
MLTDVELDRLASEICAAGFPDEYSFQSKATRDRVASMVTARGGKVRRWMAANQSIDPRYTVEGRHLPDLGLANDRINTNLYKLMRTL